MGDTKDWVPKILYVNSVKDMIEAGRKAGQDALGLANDQEAEEMFQRMKMTNEITPEQELRDMQDVPLWPFWPQQSIKNRGLAEVPGGLPRCGTLYDFSTPGKGAEIRFIDKSMDSLTKEDILKAKEQPLADLPKLIKEGWIID